MSVPIGQFISFLPFSLALSIFILYVCILPSNDHRPSVSKQWRFILPQSWRPDV